MEGNGGWEPGVIMAGSGREAGRDGAGCGILHSLSKRSNDPILKILKIFGKYFAIPLTEIFSVRKHEGSGCKICPD